MQEQLEYIELHLGKVGNPAENLWVRIGGPPALLMVLLHVCCRHLDHQESCEASDSCRKPDVSRLWSLWGTLFTLVSAGLTVQQDTSNASIAGVFWRTLITASWSRWPRSWQQETILNLLCTNKEEVVGSVKMGAAWVYEGEVLGRPDSLVWWDDWLCRWGKSSGCCLVQWMQYRLK